MECFEKIFTLTILEKSSNLDVWHNSKYALGSTYARVLNIPRFWLCNYYEYALGSTYDRLRNISGLQICQGSEYATLHRVLNMLEHAWIRLNNCGISMNIHDFLLICFECVNILACTLNMTGFSIRLRSKAYKGVFQPEYTSKNRVLNMQGPSIFLK